MGVNPPNTRNCQFLHKKSSFLSNNPMPVSGNGYGYSIENGRKCQGIHASYLGLFPRNRPLRDLKYIR